MTQSRSAFPVDDLPRFSIRTLAIFAGTVALFCGVTFAVPDHVVRGAMIIVITMTLPALLATVLVCGSRRQRAFSIGALIPSGAALMSLTIMVGMRLFESFRFARELGFEPTELAFVVGEHCRWLFASSWLLAFCLGIVCFAVSFLFQNKLGRESAGRATDGDEA